MSILKYKSALELLLKVN